MLYRVTVQVARMMEEEYLVDADSYEEARTAYFNGDGTLEDECIIDVMVDPFISEVDLIGPSGPSWESLRCHRIEPPSYMGNK